MNQTIDIEASPPKPGDASPPARALALQRVESGAVGKALTVEELHERLEYVRQVMRRELRDGVDYGVVPGTGTKPTLLQPGAQKLLLTFNLIETVRKEVLREYPGMHREYEFTVEVRAPNGKTWDGVGTCSTLESKYRWRKQERRCPECGKHTIIAGKEQYGGGWLCWAKKGGCGAKFQFNDPAIAEQASGKVENPDVPDTWNTVRKMAFKRALVAAAINATNTSELWTQDLEDRADNGENDSASTTGTGPAPAKRDTASKARQPQPAPRPAPASAPRPPQMAPRCGTPKTREWAVAEVEKAGFAELFPEWLEAVSQLLPTENLQDWPLRFVPVNRGELNALIYRLKAFSNGEQAEIAFLPHDEPVAGNPPGAAPVSRQAPAAPPPAKPIEVPRDPPDPPPAAPNSEWFMGVIVPIPRKGQKRDEYLKAPDTIGSLFEMRHGNDEQAQAARQRLWGFVHNFEPKEWQGRNGLMPPSKTDVQFREALDAFGDWFEREHPDEKL